MQLAGGCLIHKLYPLTFSVVTRPLSAFVGRALVIKQCTMPFFFFNNCISLIIPNTEWCVPYRSHEYCVNSILDSLHIQVCSYVVYPYAIYFYVNSSQVAPGTASTSQQADNTGDNQGSQALSAYTSQPAGS